MTIPKSIEILDDRTTATAKLVLEHTVGTPSSRSPMETAASILLSTTTRNAILGLFDQAVVSGTNFVTTVMIGRFCGASELGIYSLGFTLVLLIICIQRSLVTTPYTVYGIRLQRQMRAQYAGTVLLLSALLSGVAMVCLASTGALLMTGVGPVGLAPVIWMLAGVIPFLLLREFCRRLALAHLRMRTVLVLDTVVAVIQLGGLGALVATDHLSATAAYAVAGLACALAGGLWLVLSAQSFRVRREPVPRELRRHWRFGRWLLASRLTAATSVQLIPWLVMLVLDATAAGVYAAYMTVTFFANPFLLGIGNVLGPRTARAFAEEGVAGARQVVRQGTIIMGSIMAVFCALMLVFGDKLVSVLYGSEFAGEEYTIIVLAFAVLTRGLGVAPNMGLWAMERTGRLLVTRFAGLCGTVLTSLALIKPLGVLGAACGLLVGSMVAEILTYYAYRATIRTTSNAA